MKSFQKRRGKKEGFAVCANSVFSHFCHFTYIYVENEKKVAIFCTFSGCFAEKMRKTKKKAVESTKIRELNYCVMLDLS